MWTLCKPDICTKSVKIEEGIRLVGETEVKGYFTEEMTCLKTTRFICENRDHVFSLCNSESLAKYPGCNECSVNVGWVDSGFWLAVSMGKEHWRGWLPQVKAQGQVRAWGALQQWGCSCVSGKCNGWECGWLLYHTSLSFDHILG